MRKIITVAIIALLVIGVVEETIDVVSSAQFNKADYIPSPTTLGVVAVGLIVLLVIKYRIKEARKRDP